MTIREDINDLITFLDTLAKIDPVAMGALIEARVPCNKLLADHPSVQVGSRDDGGHDVGLLGILNGYGGAIDDGPRKGWGQISAVVELDGRCTGFVRTKN